MIIFFKKYLIFQKILSIEILLSLDTQFVIRIWGCNKLETRSPRKVLTCSVVSKLNMSVLNSGRRTIVLLDSLDRISNKGWRQWSLNVHISIHGCLYIHWTIKLLLLGKITSRKIDSSFLVYKFCKLTLALKD